MKQLGKQALGSWVRGDIQGAKADKDKFLKIRHDGGGFIPDTSHGKAEWS